MFLIPYDPYGEEDGWMDGRSSFINQLVNTLNQLINQSVMSVLQSIAPMIWFYTFLLFQRKTTPGLNKMAVPVTTENNHGTCEWPNWQTCSFAAEQAANKKEMLFFGN